MPTAELPAVAELYVSAQRLRYKFVYLLRTYRCRKDVFEGKNRTKKVSFGNIPLYYRSYLSWSAHPLIPFCQGWHLLVWVICIDWNSPACSRGQGPGTTKSPTPLAVSSSTPRAVNGNGTPQPGQRACFLEEPSAAACENFTSPGILLEARGVRCNLLHFLVRRTGFLKMKLKIRGKQIQLTFVCLTELIAQSLAQVCVYCRVFCQV